MINSTSIGATILNPIMGDITQRTPIEESFSDSDKEEEDPFNFLSTCVFDSSNSPFVSQMINYMVPMNNIA